MSAVALDYAYRYPFVSEVARQPRGARVRLATFGGIEEHPYFFDGRLVQPRQTADLLRGLMEVVHARYHVPAPMLQRILAAADPVVTSSDDRLRFEGFSGCCSLYARVDLLPDALSGETFARGTTNVDFNAPMLDALARIRDADNVNLSVGTGEVKLSRGETAVVEKKVALPVRWLKGFVEVQAYQSRMQPAHEVAGVEALRFLRSLPRTKMKHPAWIVASGRGLRLSQQPSSGGVRVGGLERLRILEGLAPRARSLRIYGDDAGGTCAFELVLDAARFHLVLSPDVWRGFSGEGQVLAALAGGDWQKSLPRVRAALKWEAVIDTPHLARRTGLADDEMQAALSALGARGLVGFDLGERAWFHRELPFDLSRVEALQPRLKGARKLLEEGKVRLGDKSRDQIEAYVDGSGVEHRVRLGPSGARCTCPWYSKHQGERGPCKHVLAVQMFLDGQES